MVATQNVLILSSNTGGGHRSAASALHDSFLMANPGQVFVNIAHRVLEEGGFVTRNFASMYNYLLRHRQDLMQYYYWFVQHARPNESKLVIKGCVKYGLRLVKSHMPDVIVSVHPMTQHIYARVLKTLGLQDRIPIVTVVTDPCYGFWRGWACDDVKEYYVASDDAKQQLLDYDVDGSRIKVVGMPVHSRFQPVSDEAQREARIHFGLEPDKFTVFLNAGWVGGGNVPRIAECLAEADLDVQVAFLAGTNEPLRHFAEKLARGSSMPIHVLGFTDEINRLMNASSVMVSKLGGLTTFEALASELPLIIDSVTPPMPQEAQTAEYVQRSGAGILLKDERLIVNAVQGLLDSPEQCVMMRQSARACGRPGAADLIAQNILETIRS